MNFASTVILSSKVKKYIYLTLDDGPNEGTRDTLALLLSRSIPATFFINRLNFLPSFVGQSAAKHNLFQLALAVSMGYMVGDHSVDHMLHNTQGQGSRNAYREAEQDILWFGGSNMEPTVQALELVGVVNDDLVRVNSSMSSYVRLPYTNSWRLGNIRWDCLTCTWPDTSGRSAVELSDKLMVMGKKVVGWDMEWYKDTMAREMFLRLEKEMVQPTVGYPGKVVILSHDRVLRGKAGVELGLFIDLALGSGYQFRTLDTYLED